MIYQAPSINFSNANDGHESRYMLTAPFLTSVDLCVHLEWLICYCFEVANMLRLGYRWPTLMSLDGSFYRRNPPTYTWEITVYSMVSAPLHLPLFHGCNFVI